ncbi:MAG: ATP-binding protein [Verrucomicrobia bacterium]|nr:ATP-binding protein [Verrucomicrobiota bacterium]MDA1066764.1 ATP-binding protein [Verrucomicrobiota bacterium]
MRSFRLKTVLLTVLLSGTLLISTGVIGWHWLEGEFRDALDAKIVLPGQRITEYHGWNSDWKQFATTIDTLIGEDWKADRILKLRSNMYSRNAVYQSDNWPEDFPSKDLPRFDELIKKTSMGMWGKSEGFVRYPLLDEPHLYTVPVGKTKWRMATLANPELSIYIGISLDSYQSRIRNLRMYYFGALGFVIIAIGGGAYLIASRAVGPVAAIAQTARMTSSKDLSQRISSTHKYDKEFDTLVSVINEMMDRLEISFHQAMRFSSDASHELKTPLTIIQSEISSRLQHCAPDSVEQQTLNRLMEEVERLRRIIRSLFLLSQADAGKMPLTIERYNFSEELGSFARDAEILAEEFGLRIETSIAADIHVMADRLMLGQVIQNLISNAIKHNKANGFVRMELKSDRGIISFSIENSGPMISSEDQGLIFDRFYRGHNCRSTNSPGLGLGLSLAREIGLAHNGKLFLTKSTSDSTLFELEIHASDS